MDEARTVTADELLERVLYRDGLILIIDKPAGLPVHKGPKGGPSVEALAEGLRFGLPARPELAHRLDKDTSGCLVLGRHRKALRRLGRLFAAGRVEKTYWAIVEGAPPADAGRIDLPLGRRSKVRGWWMKVDPEGLPAVTDYRVLGRFVPPVSRTESKGTVGSDAERIAGAGPEKIVENGPQRGPVGGGAASRAAAGQNSVGLTWLELRPQTGRTHQLRVHLAALGCPVLGDPIYGRRDPAQQATPLHLHARGIALPLYPNRASIAATAPPPAHMLAALRACGLTAQP